MRFLLLCLAAAGCAAAQADGVIEVSVVNAVSGAGIAGAEVRVWTQDATHAVGSTDALGNVRFAHLRAGEYSWSVTHPGYLPPGAPLNPRRERVSVAADQDAVRLRVELLPPATLRGRVLDPQGNPAAGAQVTIGSGPPVETGQDGAFALTGLRPGTYALMAVPGPGGETAQEGVRRVAVATFYPFVTEAAQAAKIPVAAGADVGGLEIRLQTAPVYRVRGVVLDPQGNPVPGAMVSIESMNPYGVLSVGPDTFTLTDHSDVEALAAEPAVTGEQGTFELPAVQRGERRLHVQLTSGYDVALHRDRSLLGSADVVVGSRDVEEVEIRLAPPFAWKGSVDWGEVPESARGFLGLLLMPLDGGPFGPAEMRPDGTLEVAQTAPGRYRFLTGRLGGQAYVASILVGNVDVYNRPFELLQFAQPFRAIVRNDGGSLRGAVEHGEGAEVVLLPHGFEPLDVVYHKKVGAGGAFEITGLRPGDYYALALPEVDPEKMDVAFFRNLLPRATSVNVERGSAAMVRLGVLDALR